MGAIKKRQAAVLLVAAILVLWAFEVSAAVGQTDSSLELNVMLVIDGSGSLVSANSGTDKDGLRYDAIELFLALLANKGNNVGAIVFDDTQDFILNTELDEVEGKQQKLALSNKIRDAGTGGDTDIGGALLQAVDMLAVQQASNQKKSVVILFSDGRTDLGDDEKAYEQSLVNKDAAITKAQEENIPIYTVCLAATQVADPQELAEIANRTGGQSVTIAKAAELSDAFEEFYQLIFSTSSGQQENREFSADGTLTFDIYVPNYGAKEINVIVDTDGDRIKSKVIAPSGEISDTALEDMTMTAGNYYIIKAADPETGIWKVELGGQPGKSVRINVIYNIDTSVELSLDADSNNIGENVPFNMSAAMYRDGAEVKDTSAAQEYDAILYLTNTQNLETAAIEMQQDGVKFTADVQGLAKGSYSAHAVLESGGLQLDSNTVMLYIANTPPILANDAEGRTVKKIVTPLTGREYSASMDDIFTDEQDDELQYSIVSSQLVADTATLDGSELTVNTAKSRSGNLVIRATDSEGAYCDYTFQFKVTNLTIPIIVLIVGGIAAAILIAFLTWWLARPTFKGLISVVDVHAGYGESGIQHGAFKGKLKLSSFGIGLGNGFDGNKTYFEPLRGGQTVRLVSSKPFFVQGQSVKEYTIFTDTEIYADENETMGVRVVLGDTDEY